MKDSTAITLQKNKVMVHEDATAIIVILSFVDFLVLWKWCALFGVCMRRMAENETRGNGTEWIVVLFHDCRSQSQLADTTCDPEPAGSYFSRLINTLLFLKRKINRSKFCWILK